MEKTLSLGAFEELSENEIMETEGGFWQYVAAGVAFLVLAGYAPGLVNNAIVKINKVTSKLAPAGTPNPYYIWTVV